MSHMKRFDQVGVTVDDLDSATAFLVGSGLEVEGRMFVEGERLDTASASRTRGRRSPCCGRRTKGPGSSSSVVRPHHEPGSAAPLANELGLRNDCFEVADLQPTVDRRAADGYGLVERIGSRACDRRAACVISALTGSLPIRLRLQDGAARG